MLYPNDKNPQLKNYNIMANFDNVLQSHSFSHLIWFCTNVSEKQNFIIIFIFVKKKIQNYFWEGLLGFAQWFSSWLYQKL